MNYTGEMVPVPAELSLESGICLGLIRCGADHGYAMAKYFEAGQPIGDIYSLTRPAVYRCLSGLEAARLVSGTKDRGARGQTMTRFRLSARGTSVLNTWLSAPVDHIREIRLDFLAKVAVREMLGMAPGPLIRAQRKKFADVFEGLSKEPSRSPASLWRREQVRAVSRFLDEFEGSAGSSTGAAGDESMILSARNQLRGAVRAVSHGGILSSVKIAVDQGQVLTSTITREAADQLRLSPGSPVTAIFKATDVIVAAAQPPR